ncbi:MAG TPA: tripartite tricarboxylate transporter TctB family protein [Thermodesulfobacteriota bacterium]|nr:tripartite tricarboxylate transporter TctB family protein [Thermodesulfobacteriota bacterium]
MNADKAGSLFWLLVAIVVAVGAFRLGLGNVRAPGIGFMPFGAAVLLGLLSIISFLRAAAKEKALKSAPLFRGTLWLRVVFVFVALLAYAQAIPLGGYNITTFLLMTFLFWIMERQKVWKVVLYALLTTVITYYVFSKWLNCQFPIGPLGF